MVKVTNFIKISIILNDENGCFNAYCKYLGVLPLEYTVGLNMHETLKKMLAQAEHIFDTFEYF